MLVEREQGVVRGARRGRSRVWKHILFVTVAAFCVPTAIYAGQAGQEESAESEGGVVGAFKAGTVHLDLRYRYEIVDIDGLFVFE